MIYPNRFKKPLQVYFMSFGEIQTSIILNYRIDFYHDRETRFVLLLNGNTPSTLNPVDCFYSKRRLLWAHNHVLVYRIWVRIYGFFKGLKLLE